MKYLDFVKLVRKMRSAQKAYFRDRRQSDLVASKQAEREVDVILATNMITPPKPEDQQSALLEEPKENTR